MAIEGHSRLEAAPGGLWWLRFPDGPPDVVELTREADGVEVALAREELAYLGVSTVALAVPPAAAPGDVYVVAFPHGARLTVVEGDGTSSAPAPILDSVDVELRSETRVSRYCRVGLAPLEEHFFALVAGTLSTATPIPPDDLLLDVWVNPAGEAGADDEQGRTLDSFPAAQTGRSASGAFAFELSALGEWQVDVRVRDARTGLASERMSALVVNTQPDQFAGWDLSEGWSWGCSAAAPSDSGLLLMVLSVLGVGLGRRRRRRR